MSGYFLLLLRIFFIARLALCLRSTPLFTVPLFLFWGLLLVAVSVFARSFVSRSGARAGVVPGASAVLAAASAAGFPFAAVRASRRSRSGFVVVAFGVFPAFSGSFGAAWAAWAGVPVSVVRRGPWVAVSVPCVVGSGFFSPGAAGRAACPLRVFRFLPLGLGVGGC